MGKVVAFDVERKQRRTEDSARLREGRKRIAAWHSEVDAKIRARQLIGFDALVARALTNFPSATLDGCIWAGQERLAGSLNRTDRTVRSSIARLRVEQLLQCQQRGNGRTCRYTFCVDGRPIFEGVKGCPPVGAGVPTSGLDGADILPARKELSGLDRTESSGLTPSARKEASAKSYKLSESCELESSPNPLPTVTPSREPDEVLPPSFATITFQDFWNASRINSATNDKVGPARSEWQKLDAVDRDQIAWTIERDGGAIDLQEQWTVTWLKHRCWEERGPIARSGDEFIADVIDGLKPRGRLVTCTPGDPVFEREYARRVAAGESVDEMNWARSRGPRSFTMRVPE